MTKFTLTKLTLKFILKIFQKEWFIPHILNYPILYLHLKNIMVALHAHIQLILTLYWRSTQTGSPKVPVKINIP